ncbi:MAG TPA: pyrroline-5-carboxylate reductase [Desulfobacteraceae bacterium]|nr:pyrroline-5-carboxylate reductase [Desulfobacteraceae bacterium]
MVGLERIGFVGAGNMAEAFIKGLLNGGFPAAGIVISEPDPNRCRLIQERYQVQVAADNRTLVEQGELILLAVKPQVVGAVLDEIRPVFAQDKLLVSILAGISTTSLEQGLDHSPRVIRAMPNTPALVGFGASALCAGRHATAQDRSLASRLFESVGIVQWVSEGQMDAVTGLSGSGPAFVFTFIEALTAGGVQQGLSRDVAHALAVQTVQGAAHLVQESADHPAVLRDRVCSPGGTTIAGMAALEKGGMRSVVMDAVAAAAHRSQELGKK